MIDLLAFLRTIRAIIFQLTHIYILASWPRQMSDNFPYFF